MSKKINNIAFRKGLEASGLDKETVDKMTNTAIANGIVSASSRIGKLDHAPQEVKDWWEQGQEVIDRNLVEWNSNLPTGQEITKVSLNCSK
jgi:hypothetical protein